MRVLNYKKAKKAPLTFWSDRLSRVYVERHTKVNAKILVNGKQYDMQVIAWFYKDNQDKPRHMLSLSLPSTQKFVKQDKLIHTQFGLICSRCNSNEHLKYRTSLMCMSDKDASRFTRDAYGMYCECCGSLDWGTIS